MPNTLSDQETGRLAYIDDLLLSVGPSADVARLGEGLQKPRSSRARQSSQLADATYVELNGKSLNLANLRYASRHNLQTSWGRIVLHAIEESIMVSSVCGGLKAPASKRSTEASPGASLDVLMRHVRGAQRLYDHSRQDAALDLIYDQIDDLMRRGQFDCINSVLAHLNIGDLATDLLLALLTATLPAARHLHSRKDFLQSVERILRKRGELEEGLLTGLEGQPYRDGQVLR